jgi:hypothetical protein
MKWLILTCDVTRHIIPAQQFLFKKYAQYPDFEYHYLDLTNESVDTWTANVLNKLEAFDDEFVVFGLDDFLPKSEMNNEKFTIALDIMKNEKYDRFELGYGCSKRGGHIKKMFHETRYLEFKSTATYTVSTQFSIWRLSSLRRTMITVRSPWRYEKDEKASAACFPYTQAAFWAIEQSALSGRVPGRINVDGLNKQVLNEMVELGLLDKNKFGIGWGK